MTKQLPAAFFWDVDGVFVDTEALHFEAWRKLFEEDLGAGLTIEEYRPCIGRGSDENMAYLCSLKGISKDVADLQILNVCRREYYEALRLGGTPLIEENIDLASQAHELFPDLPNLAVSSSKRQTALENISRAGLTDLFDHVISFEDRADLRRKPSPDLYLLALEMAGLSQNADRVIAFEDSAPGIESAAGARIRAVAIPNRFTDGQDFSKAQLVVLPGAPRDIKDILERADFVTAGRS